MRVMTAIAALSMSIGSAFAQSPAPHAAPDDVPELQGRTGDRPGISTRPGAAEYFRGHPAGELFYVATLTVQPGATLPLHTHSGPEFHYVISGEMQATTGGEQPKTLKAGEGEFVPEGTAHELKNAGNGPAELIVFVVGAKGRPITAASSNEPARRLPKD